jgi:hypothetical protein
LRIRTFLTERPNSEASVALLFLSAPLLQRKFLHGWYVISLLDPLNQGEGDAVGRYRYPHAVADGFNFQVTRIKRACEGI